VNKGLSRTSTQSTIILTKNMRQPSTTDYLAGAVISYGIVYFWLALKTVTGVPWYLAYPAYYLAGLASSYLVCKKAESDSLSTGVKSAIVSWMLTVIGILAITQQTSTVFIVTLLVLMILGGVTSADIVKTRYTHEEEPEG